MGGWAENVANLGRLCWLAPVSKPHLCARLARIASQVTPLQGSNVYRTDGRAKTAVAWQKAAILKYLTSPHLGEHAKGDEGEEM